MKRVLKWGSGVLASALVLVLVIVLTPYVASLAEFILPDISGARVMQSAVISEQLHKSARLESEIVETEGAFSAEKNALIFGTVSSVTATYNYKGIFGIDLSQVQTELKGNTLTLILPSPICLNDSIVVKDIDRTGFLDSVVRISDMELQKLLEEEKQKYRDMYLTGEYAQGLREKTEASLLETVGGWLKQANSRLKIELRWAEPQP